MTPIFITGTDTEVGKTYVTVKLLTLLKEAGIHALGLKPIASGAICQNKKWINEDAVLLKNAAASTLDLEIINPILFKPAIAPHIAAEKENFSLNIQTLQNALKPALSLAARITLVEGAGGLMMPLNDQETYADFVKKTEWPLILVVGMKLGCLNHSLLTYEVIKKSHIPFLGFITNCLSSNMPYLKENIATLCKMIKAPHLGTVHYHENKPTLNLSALLSLPP